VVEEVVEVVVRVLVVFASRSCGSASRSSSCARSRIIVVEVAEVKNHHDICHRVKG